MVKFSVIIPCSNAERTIKGIVDDVVAQEFTDWELIIVSNGFNQERQLESLRKLAVENNKINVVTVSEPGVSRARNVGVEHAHGEWVVFADADDRVSQDWLSNYAGTVGPDVDIICSGWMLQRYGIEEPERIDVNGAQDAPVDWLVAHADVLGSVWNKAYRSEFLRSVNIKFDEDISVFEDCIFNLSLLRECKRVGFLEQSGYMYTLSLNGTALSRYHESLPAAVERREALLRDFRGIDRIADCRNALEIFLNTLRSGSPLSFKDKVGLVKEIFKSGVFRGVDLGREDGLLRAFAVFAKIRMPWICVKLFSLLYRLKHGKDSCRPELSFCMLTWNRAAYLGPMLENFFANISYKHSFELIIFDNASTDDTGKILAKYACYPNVRIVHSKENMRLNAYKPLFGLARGDLMFDMDDDVLEFPRDFDDVFVSYFKAFPDYGFIGMNVIQDEHTHGNKPPDDNYYDDIRGGMEIEEGPVGGWCAAFRRKHFKLFQFAFNRLNFSIARVEDGTLSGFLHVLLRKRQGLIKNLRCLHATGPYYAAKYGLSQREYEKYAVVGNIEQARTFIE